MVHVKIPATTANMGAGFDSFGMAFDLFNEITVEKSDSFSIISSSNVPKTKDNLIYKSILHFYSQVGRAVPHLRITQTDRIPFTRGLGSSAACIVGGIVAANAIEGNLIDNSALLQMACQMDGHPDNVAPALLGGLVVAAVEHNDVNYVKINPPNELAFISIVPNFVLSTKKARDVLPSGYSREDVVFNVSRASLFIASVMSEKWGNISAALDDRIHQPYRNPLVPNMENIFSKSKEFGALGAYLSGAGPTVMVITLKTNEQEFLANIEHYLESLSDKWCAQPMRPNFNGTVVCMK